MWRVIWYVQGYARVQLHGASPEWVLARLSAARIAFLKPVRRDDFTIELLLLRKDLPKAAQAAQKAMC